MGAYFCSTRVSVDLGCESIRIPYKHGVTSVSLLRLTRPNIFKECYMKEDWNTWKECSPVVILLHSKYITRNKYVYPYHSTWSVLDKAYMNCSYTLSYFMK